MGGVMAKSGLFKVKAPEQVIALMLVAQAMGLHPATVALDYDIIQGQPAKKPTAMMRDYMASGGKVEWHKLADDGADATFTHPSSGSVRIAWDIQRAKDAQLWGKDNWKKYARSMFRSRVVSEGVRTSYPGATSGMYTPEEVNDFGPDAKRKPEPSPEPQQVQAALNPAQENGHIEDAQVVASIDTTVHDRAIDALVEELETAANLDQLLEAWNSVSTIPNRTAADNKRLTDAKNARKVTLSTPFPPGIMADPTQLPDVVFIAEEKAMDEIFGAVQVKPEPKKKGRAA